jgi:CubicO group peptidase (beta-lactamase class C family)
MDPNLLDRLIDDFLSRYSIPGLSVAIARQGCLLHAAGYGFANLEHRAPATPGSIYQAASVGKQFTAALVLLLAERGLLRLDDSIAPHFPPAPGAWSGITVRNLLTHTSGISDEGFGKLNLCLDYTDSQLVAAIAAEPLDFAPGTAWSYSNCGYILLGILIARITGRFYGDLLAEAIFEPLDMTTARVISEDHIIPNRAAGYCLDGALLRNQEYVSPTLNRTADGGLYVTVLDLAKWDRALHIGAILSPASREAMWTPVQLVSGASYPYGFGWSIATSPDGRLAEHQDEWQGFSTHFIRYLDRGLSIMVLSNLSGAPVSELSRLLAALHLS